MCARTTFAFMMAIVAVWCLGRPRPRAIAATARPLECVPGAHNEVNDKVQEVTFVMQP